MERIHDNLKDESLYGLEGEGGKIEGPKLETMAWHLDQEDSSIFKYEVSDLTRNSKIDLFIKSCESGYLCTANHFINHFDHLPDGVVCYQMPEGKTPLIAAASAGHFEIVRELLPHYEQDHEISHKDKAGLSALDYVLKQIEELKKSPSEAEKMDNYEKIKKSLLARTEEIAKGNLAPSTTVGSFSSVRASDFRGHGGAGGGYGI